MEIKISNWFMEIGKEQANTEGMDGLVKTLILSFSMSDSSLTFIH